jgi:Spy/CpxP family protein refolding chaperone
MQRQRLLALALAAAGLMAFTTPGAAQEGQPTPAPAGADSAHRKFDPVGRLLDRRSELELTEEQAARLEAIRARYLETNQPRMEELRRQREARSAFRASMDSTRTEVMAVLTPEQQKRVAEMRKESWRKWRDARHGARHHGRHERKHGHDDHHDDDEDDDSQ